MYTMTISTLTKQRSVERKRLLERTATTLSMKDQGDDAGVYKLWQGADDASAVRLLTADEQQRYHQAEKQYHAVKTSRDSAASVLEWLVFPEDLEPVTKEWTTRETQDIVDGGVNPRERTVHTVERETTNSIHISGKEAHTLDDWAIFWRNTPYSWCSGFELYQAGRSLMDIINRPTLYTTEEQQKAQDYVKRLHDRIHHRNGPNDLIVDTFITFEKDSTGALVQHQKSNHTSPSVMHQLHYVPHRMASIGQWLNLPGDAAYIQAILTRTDGRPDSNKDIIETLEFITDIHKERIVFQTLSHVDRNGQPLPVSVYLFIPYGPTVNVVPRGDVRTQFTTLGIDLQKYQEFQQL